MKFEYKFILLYLLLGLLWIFFSDNLVYSLPNGNELFHTLQTYKGFFFVIVTGIIFFAIIKKHLNKLRMAEERATKNDKLKTAFLQNISHEIRTPMNGIIGFSSLIRNNMYDSEEELEHFLELISNSSNNLLNTIENIVEISRIQS